MPMSNLLSKLDACHQHQRELVQCHKMCLPDLQSLYLVGRSRYWRLLFTSKDRICANLRVQQQSMNMKSQCRYIAFVWHDRSILMTSQCYARKDRPWRWWRNEQLMVVLVELWIQDIKWWVINKIIHSLPWLTLFCPPVMRFFNDFHALANHLIRDQNIVSHGISCIMLYILQCFLFQAGENVFPFISFLNIETELINKCIINRTECVAF